MFTLRANPCCSIIPLDFQRVLPPEGNCMFSNYGDSEEIHGILVACQSPSLTRQELSCLELLTT